MKTLDSRRYFDRIQKHGKEHVTSNNRKNDRNLRRILISDVKQLFIQDVCP